MTTPDKSSENMETKEKTKGPKKFGINKNFFKKSSGEKKEGKKGLSLGWTIILAAAALVLVFLTTMGVLVYAKKNESPFIKTATRFIPFPAVVADGDVVRVYTYLDQLDILKNYYQNFKKMDLNSEEGKQTLAQVRAEVMDRVTEDAIIEREAKKAGVKVEKKELDESFDKLVVSNGGTKDFSDILQKFYGLTIDEFKAKIYAPRVLRQKLTDKINNEESVTGAAKSKADDLYSQIKGGADFAKLAKENSQDPASAANGGDLGFFSKGKMVPEFEKAAFELNVGDVSQPVRTVYGYHIIKVTEKKGDQVKASHILIKVRDFNDWIVEKKDELKKSKVYGILPGIWQLYKI
jgi:parvulin-like peptidyl-prolyl isomerase